MARLIPQEELSSWITGWGTSFTKKPITIQAVRTHEELLIPTKEGDMLASAGDFIVRGVTGSDFYPCKPEIFAASYTRADGTPVDLGDVPEDIPANAPTYAEIEAAFNSGS